MQHTEDFVLKIDNLLKNAKNDEDEEDEEKKSH